MIKNYVLRLRQFFQHDLWVVKIKSLSKREAYLYRLLRVWTITLSEFVKDKCDEKASSLTYYSMLSLVPVVAMAFGIAQSFGLKSYLEAEISNYFSGQDEIINEITKFSDRMISTSGGGIVSGISAVFIIYAVVRLLNYIESAFNDIWATTKGRTLKRKLTDYMAVILLGPILLIISSSSTAYIVTSIEKLTQSIELLGVFQPMILFLIRLIPYTLIWFLLFLFYLIFPNTSVKVKPALIAGILAGTVFQITQVAWINGQVFLSRYNDIYGALAALPLFMIWLQLSWTIILFGAEFSFALQNVKNWSYDSKGLLINQKSRRRITLLVMKTVVQKFASKDAAISFEELCDRLFLPRRFINEVVNDLQDAKILLKVENGEDDNLYVPGMDINKMDVFSVMNALEIRGLNKLPQETDNEGFHEIEGLVAQLDQSLKRSKANQLIKDL